MNKDKKNKNSKIEFGPVLPDIYLNKNYYHTYISVLCKFYVDTEKLENELNKHFRAQVHCFKHSSGNRTFIIQIIDHIKWRELEPIIRGVLINAV